MASSPAIARCLSLKPVWVVTKQLEDAECSPRCPRHQASNTRALLQPRNAQEDERKLRRRSCVSKYSTRADARAAMRWRWMVFALPFCIGAGTDPGARLPMEVGVLSCTLA